METKIIRNNNALLKIFLLIFILISSIPFIYAQEEKTDIQAPPGMEIIKVGGFNVLAPKGAKMRKVGSLLIVESTAEYTARKILDLEERLAEAEKKEKELEREVQELKERLDEIQIKLTPEEEQ